MNWKEGSCCHQEHTTQGDGDLKVLKQDEKANTPEAPEEGRAYPWDPTVLGAENRQCMDVSGNAAPLRSSSREDDGKTVDKAGSTLHVSRHLNPGGPYQLRRPGWPSRG